MNRCHESKRRFLALAAGLAALLVVVPTAEAATTAQTEYTLDLPGFGDGISSRDVSGRPDATETGSQAGVSGETADSSSPLDSAFSTLGDGTVLLMAAVIGALALASVPALRTRLRPPSPR